MLNIGDKTNELSFPSTQELHGALVDLLDIVKGQAILDVGCGVGASISCMLKRCPGILKIVGIDENENFLGQIAGIHREAIQSGQLELIRHDVDEPLPFESGAFDRIICQNVMECVSNKKQLIDEFCRVLKSGGKVLVSHHDFDTMVYNSPYKDLTRRLVHCYSDTTLDWQKNSDGQMGRKLAGLASQSNFKNHKAGLLVFSETNYSDDTYGFRVSHGMIEAAKASMQFQDKELEEWLEDLKRLAENGEYFFSINLMYFLGVK